MTRKTSFYFSFFALPADKRRAIGAIYDFCRVVDDCVDLEPDPARARAALDRWRAEIDRVFGGGAPETKEGRALQPFVGRYRLPRTQFDALVDGVAMDVEPARFRTFADLEAYCHRVASAVGLMCAEVFGYRDPHVLDYARDLGVALQLTNILRDVAVDLRRNRRYVPTEDLERFGCTEEDLRREVAQAGRGVSSDAVRRLLEFQASRAHIFFHRAIRNLPREDARQFLAAEIMRAVYEDLLRRIEAARFDVFTSVVRVQRPRQAWLALRTYWRLR